MLTTNRGFIVFLILALSACKPGFNQFFNDDGDEDNNNAQTTDCDVTAVDNNASVQAQNVLALISDLSCGRVDGLLSGQNFGVFQDGDTPEIEQPDYTTYVELDNAAASASADLPTIAAIEYRHFDGSQTNVSNKLETVHDQLSNHWQGNGIAGNGLIAISWVPNNPWTTNSSAYTADVDIANLLQTGDAGLDQNTLDARERWLEAKTALLFALNDLLRGDDRDPDTVILFRPMPEMNTPRYWFGSDNGNAIYEDLWLDVFNFMQGRNDENLDLNHLLWVYSPALAGGDQIQQETVDWAYPGRNFVDIVAGVLRNNNVGNSNTIDPFDIRSNEFDTLLELDKPLGFGELGPSPTFSRDTTNERGRFDNSNYADLLGDFPAIAFWISWHDFTFSTFDQNGNESVINAFQSLVRNNNTDRLFNNVNILSTRRLETRDLNDFDNMRTNSNNNNSNNNSNDNDSDDDNSNNNSSNNNTNTN